MRASIAQEMVDVVIVGGGLMGCATALALRKRGRSVALLERGWCGAQASGINFGGVRRQGRGEVQLPLAQRAQRLWDDIEARLQCDVEYVRSGHLKLASDDAGMAELLAYRDMASRYDLALDVQSGEQLRARYPWLSSRVMGGSWSPQDGQANPRLFAAAFARAARTAGAQVFEQCEVADVHLSGTHFDVETSLGRVFKAAHLVNCAGAWGGSLAARFGEPVPTAPLHPNMLVTEPLPALFGINIGIVGGSFYARQVARGNIVIGGGRAGGGLSLAGNRALADVSQRALKQACSFIPALSQALIIRTWTGVEGGTPDRQPILCSSSTTPGLHHGFAFSGGGFQLAPAVGEVLSELICDAHSTTPIDAFRIDRFSADA